MIRRFALRDFKGHRDTQLELGRLTMLVGDNASGKTSVLEALALQATFMNARSPGGALWEDAVPQDLLRRGSSGTIGLQSEGTRAEHVWRTGFELRIGAKVSASARPPWELQLELHLDQSFSRGAVSSNGGANGDWGQGWQTLGTAGIYRLRADQIAAAAYSGDPMAGIEHDGTNTAVALSAMKLGDDEAFQRVEHALRVLIPSVERLRIRPATVQRTLPQGTDEVVGSKLFFDFRGAPGIPAHGASHGTLIVLSLLTILHSAKRPDLILLDDFDHALHPRAQMELVRMIKHLLTLEELADVQVVATTHSPYMLDELEPSEVQAFALRDDGTVASKRLSEHPEAERTRGALKAGQLWSLDPERDWVLRD